MFSRLVRRWLTLSAVLILPAACGAPQQVAEAPTQTPVVIVVTATPQPATATPEATATGVATATATPEPTLTPQPTNTPTPEPPTPTPSPTADPLAYPAMPTGLQEAQVVDVIDGDTVDVRINGAVERLRLIGLDTPETKDPRKPVQCFGKEASAQAAKVLAGQTVLLEEDPTQDTRDRYGRLLRYVWLPDGKLYNLEMIIGGFAHEYTYETPYKYQAVFKREEAAARERGWGFWAATSCNGNTEQAAESPPQPAAPPRAAPPAQPKPAGGNCDPSYPDVCIPPSPPDLDCGDITHRRFRVLPPDPHRFDGRDNDGIGCER